MICVFFLSGAAEAFVSTNSNVPASLGLGGSVAEKPALITLRFPSQNLLYFVACPIHFQFLVRISVCVFFVQADPCTWAGKDEHVNISKFHSLSPLQSRHDIAVWAEGCGLASHHPSGSPGQ